MAKSNIEMLPGERRMQVGKLKLSWSEACEEYPEQLLKAHWLQERG